MDAATIHYLEFYQEFPEVFDSLDEDSKIRCVNLFLGRSMPVSESMQKQFYEYVNRIQSERVDEEVYDYFIRKSIAYPELTTVRFVDNIIQFLDPKRNQKLEKVGEKIAPLFSWFIQDSSTSPDIRRRLCALTNQKEFKYLREPLKRLLGTKYEDFVENVDGSGD